ncbi:MULTISPECIES: helix-turn-helix transcriptional regulator [Niallia]|jgi:predicted ArsR family transcriptional regulator|uniref:Transcriptional regulator n=1 Tax=Niallia circulans TaxID=1397 RepID=A0A268F615_NIACI|nr:metalloregulator ArsR/SmtB family transcription factor [Niallia circulans]AYV65724.1 transcriptional regulator [Niallia circulans]AYV71466.1 transcriptional regulator [Niallia circulans]NRG30021.1 transcriptional regulator [Niallia circulans]PAD80810.1 transcriptional regulator [Niallia circulans]QJX61617.1 transcriptional regulator [Niallia circulans]
MVPTQKTTKDKILYLLKKEGSLTVNDFTDRLQITHMAVRKHLTILEKDSLIQSEFIKQPMGRPIQSFTLAEKAEQFFPKSYEGISIDLLHDVKELYGKDSVQQLFNKREERLTKEYISRMDDKDPAEKMQEMITIQNEKGYMADLTKVDDHTFEITEYNCPILEVAKEFKIACKCETEMLKKVLHAEDVTRTYCRTEGDNHCKFVVKFVSQHDSSLVVV